MITPAETREGLAPLPPTSPGDVPAGNQDLWGGERDPADCWAPGYGELPAVGPAPGHERLG
jgi:hypothetical protein